MGFRYQVSCFIGDRHQVVYTGMFLLSTLWCIRKWRKSGGKYFVVEWHRDL